MRAITAVDEFLAASAAKELEHRERNPMLWRDLLAMANPPTLTVCKHLESTEADQACPCGYPGSVWADSERVLFTMGDQWGEKELQSARIPREQEIATARLIACLYNNADWLIGLAAQAIEAGTAKTEGLGPKDEVTHD